jgi:mitochondrial fission protein ELM1
MNILSICSTEYNLEQAKGIIYWINKDTKTNSYVLRLPNIKNLFFSYFILIIYFIFLRWFTFIELENNFDYCFVCGKSVVSQSIIISHQLQIPLCTIQKPFGYPSWLFKFQFVPFHDITPYSSKNNISTIIAPNTYEFKINHLREKVISVLIGGSIHNKKYKITNIIDAIKIISEMTKYEINIITSRRTPQELIDILKINDKYGSVKNAYYNSEILIITDDSYSMISEAIQSGIKPYIIKTGNCSKKLKKGVNYLIENNYANYFSNNLKISMQKNNILNNININNIL